MDLSDYAAHSWAVLSYHNKQVFCNEIQGVTHFHDFDMGKTLAIGTDLILAFDNEHPPVT